MKLDIETVGRLTLLNTVLIGLNTLILGTLILTDPGGEEPPPGYGGVGVRPATLPVDADPVGSTAVVPTTAAPSATDAPPDPLSADPVENFILSTVRPLASAARDMGQDVTLPSEADQQACIATGDLESKACAAILKSMEEGYERFGMPFPSAPDVRVPTEPGAPPSGGAPPTPGAAPATAAGAGSQVLQVYLDTLQERLRAAAEAAGDSPSAVLPRAEDVAAAVATGDPRSEATSKVLEHLRGQYQHYGLRFTEPYVSGGGSSAAPAPAQAPAAASSSDADRELLQSYLDHMIQRLERAALDQGKDPSMLKPDSGAVAKAVASGSASSAESQAVLTTLRAAYANLDLAFTEPPM